MLQLRNSLYFNFNGIDSKRYGWMVCNVSNDTTFNLGFQRSTNKEETNNGRLFRGVVDSDIPFEITLVKIGSDGEIAKITENDLFELNRWLFVNEPRSLVVRDRKYKGCFTKCTGWTNGDNYGYVTFEFECDGYMYSNDINYNVYIDKSKSIEIKSKTNVNGELTKPIIYFTLIEGSNLKITNMTNGEVLELTKLNTGDTYSIFNKQRQMVNISNPSDFMIYANSNKKYISYVYGINRIKIETDGKCKIMFNHENKMGLQ